MKIHAKASPNFQIKLPAQFTLLSVVVFGEVLLSTVSQLNCIRFSVRVITRKTSSYYIDMK